MKNRFLWIFGFFSTFLGLGSIYELVINKSLKNSDLYINASYNFSNTAISSFLISKNLDNINFLNLLLLIGAILLSLAVLGGLIWLAVSSLGALIYATKSFDINKKAGFKKSLTEVKDKFWRLISINILGKSLIFLFLFITGGLFSLILINSSLLKGILFLLAYLILVAISLAISFLSIYASCFTVIKSNSLKESLFSAWRLFKENWIISVEAAAIMFILNLVVKLLLFLTLVLFSLPFMLLLVLFYYSGAAGVPVLVAASWIFCSIILMILAGSIFASFQIVAWTLLFDRINKGGVLSKIHRIFG